MQRKGVVTKSQKRNASKLKVGIAVAQFNADITNALLKGALTILRERNVRDDHIYVVHTYGSFELPHAAGRLIKKYEVDDEYIAHAVASGLMRIALDTGIPVGFGVLTTNNLAQARKRSRGQTNHGAAAAIAAIDAA